MKKTQLSKLFLVVLVISLCNCQEVKKESGPEYADQIKTIIEAKNAKIERWYAEGQIDSVAAHFAENCVQMPPHQPPLIGIDNFKNAWKQNVQIGTWNFDLVTNDVKANGDLAAEYGSYILTFTPNENSPIPAMTDEGNYVVLWQRINGDWKIVWDAPSPTTPMPMPAAMDTIPN
ncbi:YybH family protein [Gaetbulibacter aestuarii]|uniref:DUF4440 domain-containing protein n=1 Tax=Gaetbulibacter aestuarii TaxID=1502358 RepID=A0ABW7MUD4_9FLAO